MNIPVKMLTTTAKVPERGSDFAAGYDLFADISSEVEIAPHSTFMVPTGIATAIPIGYFGGIFARSGLSSKEGLRPANCVGVVDADYRGEIKVPLHNDTDDVKVIQPQQKVAQLVVIPFLEVNFDMTDELDSTDRGIGGFGSTGTH